MPNFGTLVWGPPEFRRFTAEIRFAEYRRGRISLLSSSPPTPRAQYPLTQRLRAAITRRAWQVCDVTRAAVLVACSLFVCLLSEFHV